jgi:hypothetical protein
VVISLFPDLLPLVFCFYNSVWVQKSRMWRFILDKFLFFG